MVSRTRVTEEQTEDQSFISEREFNDFFTTVVITGSVGDADTELTTTFPEYFPGQGIIVAGSGIIVTTGTNVVISLDPNLPVGSGGGGAGVTSINTLSGSITITGIGTNEVFTNSSTNTISVSGSTFPSLEGVNLPEFTPGSVLFVDQDGNIAEQPHVLSWSGSSGKETLFINSDQDEPAVHIKGATATGTAIVVDMLDSTPITIDTGPVIDVRNSSIGRRIRVLDNTGGGALQTFEFNSGDDIASAWSFIQPGGTAITLGISHFFVNEATISISAGDANTSVLRIGDTLSTSQVHINEPFKVINSSSIGVFTVDSINEGKATFTIPVSGTDIKAEQIDASVGLTVSGVPVVMSQGDSAADGLTFSFDPTRNKHLSIARSVVGFSKNGTTQNNYLHVGYALNSDAGWTMPRKATITAVTGFYPGGGAASKQFQIRKNGTSTSLHSFTVTKNVAYTETLNIDVAAGDRLQIFVTAGDTVGDAAVMLEVAWRK